MVQPALITAITLVLAVAENQVLANSTRTNVAAPVAIALKVENEYKEGDTMKLSCTTAGFHPAPNVTLLLGGQILVSKAKETVDFSKVACYKDNNKKLLCKATHSELMEPITIEKTLAVFFKPQPANQEEGTIKNFTLTEGQNASLSVDIFANPRPKVKWLIGGFESDSFVRYNSNNRTMVQNQKTGAWHAELKVINVKRNEMETQFKLIATNQYGHEEYKIRVSSVHPI